MWRRVWLSVGALIAIQVSSAAGGPLDTELTSIADGAPGRVGFAVAVLEDGRVPVLSGVRVNERFPMQSVFKVPIAMAVLARVDAGKLGLGDSVAVRPADLAPGYSPLREKFPTGGTFTLRELLRRMMSESDNTACDVLLRLVPPADVTARLRTIRVDSLDIVMDEKAMSKTETAQYRNWATPLGALQLLAALDEGRGLSPASRGLLLAWMSSTTIAPNRIKGMLPDGRTLAVAAFVSDSRGDVAAREGVIARLTRAAWDAAVRP
jgi:beta-lactamase class A